MSITLAGRRNVLWLLYLIAFCSIQSEYGCASRQALLRQTTGYDERHLPSAKRHLLQNADAPALNAYGGVTMENMVAAGYPLENHKVITRDGWVLNMYRIPWGKQRHNQPGSRPVVLLHHGIILNSACFTLFNANESIAYILADAGFDVWMANIRGTTFSRGNYQHSFRDSEYWYHSIDEYALIDAPAQVDKALSVTGAKKLAWVGHSQGGTVAYAMLSRLPEMNARVSVVVHMAPVVFLDLLRAPFFKAMGYSRSDKILTQAGLGEFMWQRYLTPFVQQCRDNAAADFCSSAFQTLVYGPSKLIPHDDWAVVTQTWPASVSSRDTSHWAQMMSDGRLRLQSYDHGTVCTNRTTFSESCNQERYGSLEPPEYDLSLITTPQVIMAGELDLMAVPEDIDEQTRRLAPGVLAADLTYIGYSHMDFVWDRNAKHMPDLVDLVSRYASDTF